MELDAASATGEVATETDKLTRAFRSGANWFYWIAGLSMVNTVLHLFGSERSFIIGLGLTQLFDVGAVGATEHADGAVLLIVRGIAFFLDLFIAGLFVLLGWQAGRRRSWAFVTGMVLYALDGLIFLLVQDWMSLGFHAFALFGILAGFSSLRKLLASEVRLGLRPIAPGA